MFVLFASILCANFSSKSIFFEIDFECSIKLQVFSYDDQENHTLKKHIIFEMFKQQNLDTFTTNETAFQTIF